MADPEPTADEAEAGPRADETGGRPAGDGEAPAWLRSVVWSSLAGGLCPLLPVPFLDDLFLTRFRRRLVRGVCADAGIDLDRLQVAALADRSRGFSCGRLLAKAIVYPLRKLLKKVLYFLSVKEAFDTFSRLLHEGYLIRSGIDRGALGPAARPAPGSVPRLRAAIDDTLQSFDTRPLEKLLRGVWRHSRSLLRSVFRRVRGKLATAAGQRQLEALGHDESSLEERSPEARELLDRLIAVIWAERGYRERLERALAARLAGADDARVP